MKIGVFFDDVYPYNYTYNIVSGYLTNMPSLEDLRYDGQRYITPEMFYDKDYVGSISGTWDGLTDLERIDYDINVFSVVDDYYLQDTTKCLNGGSWSIDLVHSGIKEIQLVNGGGVIVDYGYKYLTNYVVDFYCVTDMEYLIDTVKIWCVNGKYIFYTNKARNGVKLAKVRNVDTNEIVGISGVTPEPSTYIWDYDVENACNDALAFIKRQMDTARFTHTINLENIDILEDEYFSGVVIASIDGDNMSRFIPIETPLAELSDFYNYNYTGTINGAVASGYVGLVDVYIMTDTLYYIDTIKVESGTFNYDKTEEGFIYCKYRLRVDHGETSPDVESEEQFTHDYEGVCYRKVYLNGDIDNSYTVRFYSCADVEYSYSNPEEYDGIWLIGGKYVAFNPRVGTGKKVVKLFDGTRCIGLHSSTSHTDAGRLPASFLIPKDDPQYDKDGTNAQSVYGYMLNSRVFIYDVGLSLITFTISGDLALCREILDRLRTEQNSDGSFNFSYDNYVGQLFESYIRTGAIGWLIWGMCYYTLKTNDYSYADMIRKAGDWLLTKQITNTEDIRYGLLTGGTGAYDQQTYAYIDVEIEWCSTEHNCSSLQALTGLSLVLGDLKYKDSAELVKNSLFNTLYDKENNRFYQGVSLVGIDDAWALDCSTWAGKTLLSIYESEFSERIENTVEDVYVVTNKSILTSTEMEHYNTRYTGDTVDGVKPYDLGYDNPPSLVWTEGTLGYIALLKALGNNRRANYLLNETMKLQYCNGSSGGIIYTTETWASLPWEFHVWESIVSSAWFYILNKDYNALFPHTFKPINPISMSFNFKYLAGALIKTIKREEI
jgi:hypothetical protein